MADSPAKRHRTRILAAAEALRQQAGALRAGGTEFERHMMLLQEHRLRLKQIQSEEGKAEFKRDALHEYNAYIEGVLAADAGSQDEVVTTVMVWCIDAGLYQPALDLADYVLRHRLEMPDRFKRTTGCLIAEEIAEAALQTQDGDFDPAVIARATALTAEQDMPDQVRAKLYLAAGRAVLRNVSDDTPLSGGALRQCVADLKRAIELHGACGGKKDLERAERLLKKHAAASETGTRG
ncbi:phage terminase small subunit [Pseudoxanthomonas wuyuanensis]|uniref:Phage small terminase subunit n=1 Tax=Pseudoxanthomonas wuyuanensis TaxID=1073196 RepID=A0A286D4V0_9GAMM|nr:phage terminase small subunit [Pseudoxanthomonas wuyuanensis]KAF1719813.1 terminase [Pseudoxanthomonas wuyuanensis]SOD53692.1 Phage small terminase subunit [Pseudoxanthomonas wuyuanensis]